MAKKSEINWFVAICFTILVVGGVAVVAPDPPPEYDLSVNPFGTLPNDVPAGTSGGECDDGGSVGTPVDDDGDGLANEADPSCVSLIDLDGNGICDGREYAGHLAELGPDYFEQSCTGWE